MNEIIRFVDQLEKSLVLSSLNSTEIEELVNLDSADKILRKYLPISNMREKGSFFTGQKIADNLFVNSTRLISNQSIILDPACGTGNLLIEVSRKLSVQKTLSSTLIAWNKQLIGWDIEHYFIRLAKIRLIVEAVRRGVILDCDLKIGLEILSNIQEKDALQVENHELSGITHLLMNPPFTSSVSPKRDFWSNGKVNTAGIFIDLYIRKIPLHCELLAILPDVIRSGSRYKKLRDFISLHLSNGMCSVYGRFNSKTDTDVFILSGIKSETEINTSVSWSSIPDAEITLADFFDVTIGSLVAYRDPEEGPLFPYFHSKNCPVGATITATDEYRAYSGRTYTPPFIVIKRTSSPSDKNRAAATLINLNELVAVENHLIVIRPKSTKIEDCQSLLKLLSTAEVNYFLNDRARMRHLTIETIKKIPFCLTL